MIVARPEIQTYDWEEVEASLAYVDSQTNRKIKSFSWEALERSA